MIQRIITFSVRNKFVIGLFMLAWIGIGIYSLTKVPIDAVPDITNNQVQILTQAPNLGAQEMEQFITYPIELAMANLPGVVEIRSISRFGLSTVTVVFEEDMGTYLPRQLVAEKLSQVRDEIPENFGAPEMGPISTGLGEIFQYTLKIDSGYSYSPTELRTFQDWIVKRQMAMVAGVVEVNSFGGYVKQYQVQIDPDRLKSMGISVSQIFNVLQKNNNSTGGAYIEKDRMAIFIRGEGLAKSLDDLRAVVVDMRNGVPITIADVAEVDFGHAVRYGAFTKNGQGEAVGGMIMMLKGANSNAVITAVKERIALIEKSLPEGVYIEAFLDRSNLISSTTDTVTNNLIEGALIVIFVLVILLGNWRGGLIVASTIPLSLLFAFILMHAFDVWANLMSLGAIDFGIIVDGAVIIVEGTVFMLHRKLNSGVQINQAERNTTAIEASKKMMNSAFFGQLIVLIVFIPILGLEGIEGKMFRPMALTFIFAMIGVMILCLTYVPMISALTLRAGGREIKWGDHIVRRLENGYDKLLAPALRRSKWVLASAMVMLGAAIFTFTRLGGEFIPQLDEGDIAFHIILKPGSNLEEMSHASTKVESLLLAKFPEIRTVVSRIGVSEVATDLMPMDMADSFIILKPKEEWVSAETKEELIQRIRQEIEKIPGYQYEFTQPIEMRFNELMTGVREDIAIKIFGEDLEVLAQKANEISSIVSGTEGIGDLRVEATTGLPQITVSYNRDKLARYGLHVDDINKLIETAFGGGKAGVIFEGEKRFDLVVRLQEMKRNSLSDLYALFVDLPDGNRIPLSEVAEVRFEEGPMQISRDNTNRRTYVGINVQGRDIQSLVKEIRDKLDAQLELPPGYYIRYGGTFENFERATKRLQLLVPVALALIFILIFFALRSFKQSAMIYIAIPMAAIGGVFSLWLRDMPFSISAGVGFIVLFGVAVLNGLVLISAWNELKEEGIDNLDKRIRLGARRRIRPILLTALTDILGFLPMALSTSAGAEVQQPLATVVIGGMLTATLLTLFVLPVLYRWTERSQGVNLKPMAAVALIGFSLSANAQTNEAPLSISLEAALNRARIEYPSLQAAILEIEQQKALKKTAWNLGNTGIFTAGEEMNAGEGVVTVVGFQQQNIDLLGVPARRKLRIEAVHLAEAKRDLSEAALEQNVKTAYAQLYAKLNLLSVYQSLDTNFSEFERAAKIRFDTEATSKLEYLAATNQRRQVAVRLEQAYRDYRIALQRFNLWLMSDTVFTVEADFAPDKGYEPQLSLEMHAHPRLQVAAREVIVADRQISAQAAAFMPQLNLQYGIQEIEGTSGFYQYQFGIQFPLLFFDRQGQVQAAKIEKAMALERQRQAQAHYNADYYTAVETYFKWRNSWRYYRDELLPLIKEQRIGSNLSYKQGAIDYVVFLQHMNNVMELEIEAWQAFEKYTESLFELEYFTGNTEKP